ERSVSEITREEDIYRRLLWYYRQDHVYPHLMRRRKVESMEVMEVDQLDVRTAWITGISYDEDRFILRNLLIKVNGRYEEGHGVLTIVYFPHETERVRKADAAIRSNGETEPVDLSDEADLPARETLRGLWPRYTVEDLYQSMAEVAFE
ncbi:hypothetical protein PYCCODRAFT_1350434, partial [Trametes coccinea BRFM310]